MSCFVVFAVRFEKQNTTKKKKEINADGPFFFLRLTVFTLFSPFSNCKENTSALFLSHTTSPRRTCIVAALWSWCRGTLGINNNNNNYNKKSVGSFHFFFSFSQLGNHKLFFSLFSTLAFFFLLKTGLIRLLLFIPLIALFFFGSSVHC